MQTQKDRSFKMKEDRKVILLSLCHYFARISFLALLLHQKLLKYNMNGYDNSYYSALSLGLHFNKSDSALGNLLMK